MYFNNILVFLNNKEEYVEYIKEVLRRLRKVKLFIKLLKCK
jgi:hypothetical protein